MLLLGIEEYVCRCPTVYNKMLRVELTASRHPDSLQCRRSALYKTTIAGGGSGGGECMVCMDRPINLSLRGCYFGNVR